jgi:hypothetical protein
MRKLCTDEVGGVKMKKMKKKHVLQFEKKNKKIKINLHCSFLAALLALHFKDDS